MSISLTFKEIEQQVVQLPAHQQLKLIARISEKLSDLTPVIASREKNFDKKL